MKDGPISFMDVIAAEAKCKKEDIYGHDLSLVSLVPGTIWGADNSFVSSPRLDDLQCAFAAFRGYTMGKKEKHISVFALFDNEEVGSGTVRAQARPSWRIRWSASRRRSISRRKSFSPCCPGAS